MNVNFSFDFSQNVGPIRAMHGVGQPPIMGISDSMFHYLTEAGIPYSRLHDVGGPYGGNKFVDISNVFRDFSADETLEESYDFAFTDILIKGLIDAKVTPIFRLGETIENYHYVRAYRIFPPKDMEKWARICEHIVRHYNEGWANGYRYGIRYFEIWNEPDNGRDNSENQMWHGTDEEYYRLYVTAAKHLKAVFGDKIMVGGFGSTGFRYMFAHPEKYGVTEEISSDPSYGSDRAKHFADYAEAFFAYVKKEGAPIDFFSWHSYLSTARTVICARHVEDLLREYGYEGIETQLNEWNNVVEDNFDPKKMNEEATMLRGTAMAAAKTLAMFLAMQDTKTTLLCYYDARCGVSYYGGMFNPLTRKPEKAYYAFTAFNELYKLGTQVKKEGGARGVYAQGATDGKNRAVLFTNESVEDAKIRTDLTGLPNAYILDEKRTMKKIRVCPKRFTLKTGTFLLLSDLPLTLPADV